MSRALPIAAAVAAIVALALLVALAGEDRERRRREPAAASGAVGGRAPASLRAIAEAPRESVVSAARAPAPAPADLARVGGAEDVREAPPASGPTIRVRTVDAATHELVGGARVHVVDRFGTVARLRTDRASGELEHAVAAPGRYWARAGFGEHRLVEREVVLGGPHAIADVELRLERLDRLAIFVRAPDGRPFRDFALERERLAASRLVGFAATAERPPPRLDARHARRFAYRLHDPPSPGRDPAEGYVGYLLLEDPLPAWVSLVVGPTVLATERAPAGCERVDFVVAPEEIDASLATIRMRLVDAGDGSPITGATVFVASGRCVPVAVRSDASGVAVLPGQVPGPIGLHVDAGDGFARRRDLVAEPGLNDLGEIPHAAPVTIRGRLLGPPAASVRDARLELVSIGPAGSADLRMSWSRAPREDGTFELDAEPGRWLLSARWTPEDSFEEGPLLASERMTLDLRAGPLDGVELRLRPCAALVLRPLAGTWRGERFELLGEDEWELSSGTLDGSAPVRLRAIPGDHRLRVVDPATGHARELAVPLRAGGLALDV